MDIASLYHDVSVRHGLTARLKLEGIREVVEAETSPDGHAVGDRKVDSERATNAPQSMRRLIARGRAA